MHIFTYHCFYVALEEGVLGRRGQCERMPLIFGDSGRLEEDPLSSLVVEPRRLGKADLHDLVTLRFCEENLGRERCRTVSQESIEGVGTKNRQQKLPKHSPVQKENDVEDNHLERKLKEVTLGVVHTRIRQEEQF